MNDILANIQNMEPELYLTVFLNILPGLSLGIFTGLSMWWGCHYLARNGKIWLDKRNIRWSWVDYVLQALDKTQTGLFVIVALYVAVQLMPYMESIDQDSHKFLNFFVIVQVGLWAASILRSWAVSYAKANRKKDAARVMMVETLLVRVGLIAILAVVLLFSLLNFGVDITAMLAGLGIGGLAVAFAFQNILKDFFSSFSIVFDKPFVIDDFIASNDVMGSVEHIGMKTTRIRALSGEQVVVSNDDLLSSRIRNYGRMAERRVVFGFGVAYQTSAEQLQKIPEFIEKLLKKYPDVRFDRCHLTGFGVHELKFETVYFVTKPDYLLMMNINQEVFLDIIRHFEREDIRFGLPYQMEEVVVTEQNKAKVAQRETLHKRGKKA